MVLLTMTPSMVEALESLGGVDLAQEPPGDSPGPDEAEPLLAQPAVGGPISHGQVVDLWNRLQASQSSPFSLEALLKGSRVYVPPPPPKPEPVRSPPGPGARAEPAGAAPGQSNEYKALMARLRREEAARAYQRMVDPRPRLETFGDRFPTATRAFAEANRPTRAADLGDHVAYREASREVMLIINFLVSIVGVAATLWVSGRWWSLPARVFLSLAGAIVVAIAEVGVYQGYLYRLGRARDKQRAVTEVKEVVKTWVVGKDEGSEGCEGVDTDLDGEHDSAVLVKSERQGDAEETVRWRRPPTAAATTADD